MQFHLRRGLAALCLGLCLPVSALASGVQFETVSQRAYGGPPTAGNAVALTAAEADATGLTQLLPPGAQIDWDTEMLLGVFMGTRSSGGYSIAIEQIELRGMPTPDRKSTRLNSSHVALSG